MRWFLLSLTLICLTFGCDKEIHEAKTPLPSSAISLAQ
jgi:hypothetical protein